MEFRDEKLARWWEGKVDRFPPHLPPETRRPLARKLLLMEGASSPDDLRIPPGNRLEKLKGDRMEQYSIRVNQQWRICFRWNEGQGIHDVEVIDYH